MIVRMYCAPKEHNPPHIHVYYQEHKEVISIHDCNIIEGDFPRKQSPMVLAWVEIHKDELLADWELASKGELPFPVELLK